MSILPSCKRIKVTCPYCGQNFTYVIPRREERFEYIIEIANERIVTCPSCQEKMDLGRDMICAPCMN